MSELPKYTTNQQKGRTGEIFFELFVTQSLDWVYRSVPQSVDFGIDGYIDIIDSQRQVTGQIIAVQIKCGDSYFNKTNDGGIRYEGKEKHLQYYMGLPVPVILVVFNSACTKAKWVQFDFEVTSETTNGWWIEIPNRNDLFNLKKNNLGNYSWSYKRLL